MLTSLDFASEVTAYASGADVQPAPKPITREVGFLNLSRALFSREMLAETYSSGIENSNVQAPAPGLAMRTPVARRNGRENNALNNAL